MSDDDVCSCPAGRPLGMPHLSDCPEASADVLVFRSNQSGRPVAVPGDIVSATERAYAAYERRLNGVTWEQIALEGQWPTGAAAAAEVKRYLEEGREAISTFKRAEVSQLWNDRLEMLWAAVLPEARNGKIPSVMAALAVAKQSMVLAGLDQPSSEDTAVATVVVPSEDYIASLRRQSEAS